MGLTDDVGPSRIEKMAKAISKNETLSGPLSSLKEFNIK